jgi:hypothetical protein
MLAILTASASGPTASDVTILELTDLPRPFKALREVDIDEVAGKIKAKL